MTRSIKGLVCGAALAGVVAVAGVLEASVNFVAVDDSASLSSAGVVVTGSVVCTTGDELSVSATVLQLHGHDSIAGAGVVSGLICTGSSQGFAVPVEVLTPPNRGFKKGPANVILSASTSDGGGNFDDLTQALRIHISN
jgi:hypothetical protein